MRTGYLSRRIWTVGLLSLAIGGCGNSGSGGTGAGGSTVSGGGAASVAGGSSSSAGSSSTIVTGGSASGGTSSSGRAGQISTGDTKGSGGGQTAVGPTGSNGGTPASGGTTAAGQTVSSTGSGGQTGRTTTGGGLTGGSTSAGGQAGRPTTSGGLTGGATGGQAGRATGGVLLGGSTGTGGQRTTGQRPISFGTLLDAKAVVAAAQQLAKSLANPSSAQWQAKGDQHRTYRFAEANVDEPYRICVPTNWDGQSKLPLVMFLHGSGSNENSYLDQNNKQLVTLAQEHGYLLVSPLGDQGAYGNFLRLTSPFGNPAAAADLMAQVTTASERTNELSEKDVINVLELVINEYPVDPASMFLAGHSMGSGGTWYIGGKYADYWKGLAPMSGPFVQETGYPWDSVRKISLFVTEGTQAPSVDASRVLRDWLKTNGFKAEYKEVNADHGGMIKLVLPDVFDFFDRTAKL